MRPREPQLNIDIENALYKLLLFLFAKKHWKAKNFQRGFYLTVLRIASAHDLWCHKRALTSKTWQVKAQSINGYFLPNKKRDLPFSSLNFNLTIILFAHFSWAWNLGLENTHVRNVSVNTALYLNCFLCLIHYMYNVVYLCHSCSHQK